MLVAWKAAAPLSILLLIFYVSCANNQPPPPFEQPGQPAPPVSPSSNWLQVSETVTCAGGAVAECAGFYGFSVDSGGNYTTGPSPSGETITGLISPTQLSQLDQDATAVAMGDLTASPSCGYPSQASSDTSGSSGSSERINLTPVATGIDETVFDFQSDTGLLCTVGDPASAEALQTDLNTLVSQYYPLPFPVGGGAKSEKDLSQPGSSKTRPG